ncbi:MAG TPA: phosphohistidine phosphatase [Lentisphaeria bacterium]|nr:MAG: hypothetical protein A2X47_01445 [Lentisphaerae bacterium GWF2_38_69]HBM17560.1 phosphohistidine phosphatase [Lentisphaeria bacterium]
MLKLFLLRHAKSSWDDISFIDIERPLGKRGLKDAPNMGKYFIKDHKKPHIIISSPARRARETAELFSDTIEYKLDKIHYDQQIYEASLDELMHLIHKIDDAFEKVMLVGHNPGFTDLANHLTSETHIDNIPTCGLFAVGFDVKSWKKIEPGKGVFLFFDYPKKH